MDSKQFLIELYIYLFSSVGIFALMVVFVVMVLIMYSKRQKAFKEESERKAEEFKNELSKVQNEVIENLMKQVYAEIHDNLGQQAAVLKLQLHSIHKFNKPEMALGSIDTLNSLIDDMKALSVSLNPQVIKSGSLKKSLEFEIKRVSKTGLINVVSDINEVHSLPDDVTLVLYRVSQELFQNILKHSKASEIQVFLSEDEDKITLEIRDNGIGIQASKVEGTVSTGLQNLAKRCELIGANLELSSSDQGTIAKILYFR